MGSGQKNLLASVAVPLAPVVRVPIQRPLPPNVTSLTSVANDKGDIEMILGVCTDLLAFALQLEDSTSYIRLDDNHSQPAGHTEEVF